MTGRTAPVPDLRDRPPRARVVAILAPAAGVTGYRNGRQAVVRTARMALWVVLAVMGGLWTLQGVDVFGQDDGMNGRSEWIVIGLLALIGGAVMAYRTARAARR